MRRASRGAEERTWARGHSKTRSHSKQKRQDAQADDEDITRTRYEVRAEEEVRDNGRTGGPARSSGSTRCSSHGDGPALECLSAGAGPERVRCLLSGSSPDLRSSITSAPRLPREKHGERQAKARAKRGLGPGAVPIQKKVQNPIARIAAPSSSGFLRFFWIVPVLSLRRRWWNPPRAGLV